MVKHELKVTHGRGGRVGLETRKRSRWRPSAAVAGLGDGLKEKAIVGGDELWSDHKAVLQVGNVGNGIGVGSEAEGRTVKAQGVRADVAGGRSVVVCGRVGVVVVVGKGGSRSHEGKRVEGVSIE
eukprot:3372554-Pleurochrysis_carterae.AAC.1